MEPTFYIKDYLKDAQNDSEAIELCLADIEKMEEQKTVILMARTT